MTDGFIGRGERRAVHILSRIFAGSTVLTQVPIRSLISADDYNDLSDIHKKHLHDIVIYDNEAFADGKESVIVIEINYRHGGLAYKKWDVHQECLHRAGRMTCTVEDTECLSLFKLDKNGRHVDTWQDWLDIILALENEGIECS